jgi:hypothetical protein
MESNPEISVLGSAYEIIDSAGCPKTIIKNPLSDYEIRRLMIFQNPICHPSVIYRKEIILAAGGYLGGCHSEDYDLWLRLSLLPDIKFSNLSMVLLGYRYIGVGAGRKSLDAYASMAGSQFRTFIISGNMQWLLAVVISVVKAVRALLNNILVQYSFKKDRL